MPGESWETEKLSGILKKKSGAWRKSITTASTFNPWTTGSRKHWKTDCRNTGKPWMTWKILLLPDKSLKLSFYCHWRLTGESISACPDKVFSVWLFLCPDSQQAVPSKYPLLILKAPSAFLWLLTAQLYPLNFFVNGLSITFSRRSAANCSCALSQCRTVYCNRLYVFILNPCCRGWCLWSGLLVDLRNVAILDAYSGFLIQAELKNQLRLNKEEIRWKTM